MSQEIVIDLRLRFSRRGFAWGLAAFCLAGLATDVASENVTLSTYYPAPSGVYTQLVTTNQTILARDGGNVGIGTGAPAYKLDVNGAANVSGNLSVGGNLTVAGNETITGTSYLAKIITTGNNTYSTANPQAADITIGSTPPGTRHDSSMMFWSNASASRIFNQSDNFYLSVWNRDAVTGWNVALAATPGGSSEFKGNVGVGANLPSGTGRGYVYIDNSNTGCASSNFVGDTGAGTGVCTAAQYATFTPGFYIGGWSTQNQSEATFLARNGVYVSKVLGQTIGITDYPMVPNASWVDAVNPGTGTLYCCPK